ncbi:WD40/YVTN/BNR-like repeat-containing protein [Pelagicoccus mobilis]|uniref:Uncharacterized protein n=1 Tax=Pelagicoccus mobilis TaxID=415221 RepID=A0A934RTD9_9BACT|nr:hypothetical protein [Pelagicoccus mobilis]MBK1877240.1 hypothetical protein [Pelagicoccus mobilis]
MNRMKSLWSLYVLPFRFPEVCSSLLRNYWDAVAQLGSQRRSAALRGIIITFAAGTSLSGSTDKTGWYNAGGMGGNGFVGAIDINEGSSATEYDVALGLDTGGVWVSADEGDSFMPIGGEQLTGWGGDNSRKNGYEVKFIPGTSDKRDVLVGTLDGNIFRTSYDPSGIYSLQSVYHSNDNEILFTSIEFAPSNSNVVYAASGNKTFYFKGKFGGPPTQPEFLRSTDAGLTWQVRTPLPIPGSQSFASINTIAVHPTDEDIVFAASDVGLFKTTNGGSTWTKIHGSSGNVLPHDCVFGVAVSETSPNTMYASMMPYADMRTYLVDQALYVFQNPGNVGGIYKTTDGGTNWTKMSINNPPDGLFGETGMFYDVAVSQLNANRVYAAYRVGTSSSDSRVFRTTNGGTNWTGLNSYSGNFLDFFIPQSLAVQAISTSSDHLVVTGAGAGIYKSTDSGASFLPMVTSSTSYERFGIHRGWGMEAPQGNDMHVDANDPSVMYYAEADRGFWKSEDYGNSWLMMGDPNNSKQGKGIGIISDPDNSDIVYAWSAFPHNQFQKFTDRTKPHFFKNDTAGDDRLDENNDPLLNGVPEANIFDLMLDPTPLSAANALTSRTLYAAVGSTPFYKVRVRVDTVNELYYVYVYGTLVSPASGLSFRNSISGGLDKMIFEMGQKAGEFRIDSVKVVNADTEVYSEGFNDYSSGQSVPDWTFTTKGNGVVDTTIFPNKSDRVLKIESQVDGDTAEAECALSSAQTGEEIDVFFDVFFNDTTNWKEVSLRSGSTVFAKLAFTNGELRARDSVAWQTLSGVDIESITEHRGVYKSVNSGASWTTMNSGLPGGMYIRKIRIDPNNLSTLYIADASNSQGGVFKHTGTGSWSRVMSIDKIEALATVDNSGSTVVFAASNDKSGDHGIYRSTNGGSTWTCVHTTDASDGEPVPNDGYRYFDLYADYSGSEQEVLAATTFGVLRSTDGGTTWNDFNKDIPYASTLFIKKFNDSLGERYYAGLNCEGVAVRYKLPFDVTQYRRKGSEDIAYTVRKAVDHIQVYPDAAWSIDDVDNIGYGGDLYLFTSSFEDRNRSDLTLSTIELEQDAIVHALLPTGLKPDWLSEYGFVKRSGVSSSLRNRDDVTTEIMDIWTKDYLSEDVLMVLGGLKEGNPTSGMQYIVFIEKASNNTLFADDFETQPNPSPWTDTINGFSHINDSGNTVFQSDNATGTCRSYAGQSSWTDYAVEAKMKASSWGGSQAGLIARYSDNSNYYLLFYKPSAGTLTIQKNVGGTKTNLASEPATLNPGDFYNLKFVVSGNNLLGYLNDIMVVSATDSSHSSGRAGVNTYKQIASFDDFSVKN